MEVRSLLNSYQYILHIDVKPFLQALFVLGIIAWHGSEACELLVGH